MHGFDDYYRILQVHYLAEPEVIESAYKRLAKKYHPDASRNADTQALMAKINQAYAVLRDPEERRKYHLVWKEYYDKNHPPDARTEETGEKIHFPDAAKDIIDEYFKCILHKSYDRAFELLSETDKKNTPRNDFVDWQNAVSKLYHLKEYDCRVSAVYRDKSLNGHVFNYVVDFNVMVVEYNAVMDMVEKGSSKKIAVLEEGKWRIFLGYEDLQPLIEKYRSLSGFLEKENMYKELVNIYGRNDLLTGLLNRKGILERLHEEKLRFDRYGNVFSLMLCKILLKPESGMSDEGIDEQTVLHTCEILQNNLRRTDIIGRWCEDTFLILLPETNYTSVMKATEKMNEIFEKTKLIHKGKKHALTFSLAATEYAVSMQASLIKILQQLQEWK